MSEYQYYEFQAIDQPLTEAQRADVATLSSRARVTSHSAAFVYNYGDFHGDPFSLLSDYFDVMLYMANWGSRQLMFALPTTLLESQRLEPYCSAEEINVRKTKNKKKIIVDLNFQDEEQAEWTAGEDWLDDLVAIREELIQGDFRVLYLAWLKAASLAPDFDDIDEETLEPPVPAGLGQLSPALKTFVYFLDIDEALVAAAAQTSAKQDTADTQLETWIAHLPEAEQHDFLVRLSRGENNLSILLNRRLQELASKTHLQAPAAESKRRTLSAVRADAESWRQKKKEQQRRTAERAQRRKVEALAGKESQVWQEVTTLIEDKKASAYEKAVALLKDLRDLASYQDKLDSYTQRLVEIEQTYASRSALLRRMRQAKLIG